jgi:hypothetical protein
VYTEQIPATCFPENQMFITLRLVIVFSENT